MNLRRSHAACLLVLCGRIAAAAADTAATAPVPAEAATTNDLVRVDGMWVDLSTARPDDTPDSPYRRLAIGMDTERRIQRSVSLEPPTPAAADRLRAERHMANALERLRQGRMGEALIELRDGLTLNPTHPQLMAYTAMAYAQMQEFERASEYFERYLRLFPNDIGMSASYAAVLLRLSRFNEVGTLLTRIESLDANHLPTRFNRLCLDFIREQRSTDRSFWSVRPMSDLTLLVQWLLVDQEGLTGMLGQTDYNLLCEVVLGPEAPAHLAEASDALAAGETAWKEGDAAGAMAHWTTAAQWIDGYGLQEAIANAAEEAGRLDEALALREAQTRRFSGWAPAWIAHGQMLLRLGRREEGLASIRQARPLPGSEAGYPEFALAAALALNGQIPEAQRMFTGLAQHDPEAFRRWIDTDPALRAGFTRIPNHTAILRFLGVPPEME
jgi:tetratricopeptide (TPR) repeat protein